MSDWVDGKDSQFTPLTGKVTYRGEKTQCISVHEDDYATLNGVKMFKGQSYRLNNGDIIETKTSPLTTEDTKWRFEKG